MPVIAGQFILVHANLAPIPLLRGVRCGFKSISRGSFSAIPTIYYLLFISILSGFSQTNNPPTQADFAKRAEQVYLAEQKKYEGDPTNSTVAWQFGRAAFDWADFATSKPRRAEIANAGIAACRQATLLSPTLAPGHYYLALNLGQLAQTKSLGALRLVDEMESELKLAAAMDSKFDYAGADRTLGMLYLDTPGWPASIGSHTKARAHLQRAVELSPDFPDNRLSLAEALIKLGDKKKLQPEVDALAKLLPTARTNLTGEAWAVNWADWDKRWAAIRKKTGQAK